MKFPVSVSVSDPGVRQFGRLMGPSFFGMGVYQINLFVDTLFATSSRMPSGSIMSLYVADRVMQLVLGSYAIAMSTALLPTMSHQLAAGKLGEMKHTFGFALRIVSFITIPAAVGLVLLRSPIISGAVPARPFCGGVDRAYGERAAVLCAGAAGIRRDQTHHSDVLFGAGHGHAGARGSVCFGRERSVKRGVPAFRVPVSLERKSGARKFARGLFQFRAAVSVISQALWRAGLSGRGGFARKNGNLRGGNGDRYLFCAARG